MMRASVFCVVLVATLFAHVTLSAPVDEGGPELDPRDQDSPPSLTPDGLPQNLRAEYDKLSPKAAAVALEKLSKLTALNDKAIHLDNTGYVYALESFPDLSKRRSVTREVNRMRRMFSGTNPTSYIGGIPIHHSRPGAPNVIYIDFNGMSITGRIWNNNYGQAVFNAVPYDTDGNMASFSLAEQLDMSRMWSRIAEDYAPFNVDVTTQVPASFGPRTGTLLITKTVDAQGRSMPEPTYAGYAYINVFGDPNYQYYSPALVYYDQLGNGHEEYTAECASHEMGHNLGLTHDGTSSESYYRGVPGQWAPIMGAAYNVKVSVFNPGTYPGANNNQDDLAIIAAKLTYRLDDHGNSIATARALTVSAAGKASATGIIERNTDIDVFTVTATGSGTMAVSVNTYASTAHTPGANLDVLLRVTNAAGTLLASFDSTATTSAIINSIPLTSAGKYYIWVRGIDNPVAPYPLYGSIGQYNVAITLNIITIPTTVSPTVTIYSNAFSLATSVSTWTQIAPATQYRIWQWGKPTALNHPRDRNVLGTVLTGTGLYPEGIPSSVVVLSPSISTANYKGLKIGFSRFLGIAADDVATFWVCPYGKACIILWTNGGQAVRDTVWTRVTYSLPASAEGPSIRIRFGLGPTRVGPSGVTSGPGWSLSNLVLTGRYAAGAEALAGNNVNASSTEVAEGESIELLSESP